MRMIRRFVQSVTVLTLAACLWAALSPGAALRAKAADGGAFSEVLREAGGVILQEAESTAEKVRESAMDPEGRDVIITASGKVLRRTDGKWVVPEEKPSSEDEITLVFTGDIIFERGQNPWSSIAYNDGIEACFDDETWSTMQDADFLIVNNEFPYTERGSAIPGKKFTFRCPPWTAGWIKEMGKDIAALANNHINDFGQDGMMDTFDALDEEEIPYIGAGRDLEDAEQTAYCIANGMTTAILNATEIERYENPETRGATEDSPGVFRCLYMDRLCEKVREAKKKADFCIVFIHWGTELMPAAEYGQVEKAQALVDAGADLIVGAHPHVLQNIEYIDGVPVFYSLGNYFFSAGARDSGVLRITLNCGDASIKKLQFIPMEQYRGVSTLDGSEKERVLDQMRSVSPGVAIDEDGFFTED